MTSAASPTRKQHGVSSWIIALVAIALILTPALPVAAQGALPSDITNLDQDTAGVPGANEPSDRFGQALATADFNGDGYVDLAIGAAGEDLGAAGNTGMVTVTYGGASGLSGTNAQAFHQNTPGIPGNNESSDQFGSTLAAGDFNGDGYDDLAIGTPLEDLGGNSNAGMVTVLFGSSAGLTATGAQAFNQNTPGVPGINEYLDEFGRVLAVGDFNGDTIDDLAIGTPTEHIGPIIWAGVVTVLFGSPTGLTTVGAQGLNQNTPGVPGSNEASDTFGQTLAVGDFNGDNIDDLAIGTPREDLGTTTGAGMVTVLFGSPTGLTTVGAQGFNQNTPGVPGVNESSDRFGSTLAAGDFNGDNIDDLAIGIPWEDLGTEWRTGMVTVLFGSTTGLTASGAQQFNQNTAGIPDSNEKEDRFGGALATGDFNGDNIDDLAINTPREGFGAAVDSGNVTVLFGSTAGLSATGVQEFNHITAGIAGLEQDFGLVLATGDFNSDGSDDLAAGTDHYGVGAVTIIVW